MVSSNRWGRRIGSSPLARGLLARTAPAEIKRGIIPARAGFTTCAGSSPTPAWDHPRSRGVYLARWRPGQHLGGSSPLARGLLHVIRSHGVGVGIIPARAGFTHPARTSSPPQWDHPRSRGVYTACSPHSPRRTGSSPLARGLPTVRALATSSGGIIPARAGFTGVGCRRRRSCWDHPRSRGVYAACRSSRCAARGSSPLARGLRRRRRRLLDRHRIIPARAGFTIVRLGTGHGL